MPPQLFDNWQAEPLAPAHKRITDADEFYIRCLIELVDARHEGREPSFRTPVADCTMCGDYPAGSVCTYALCPGKKGRVHTGSNSK